MSGNSASGGRASLFSQGSGMFTPDAGELAELRRLIEAYREQAAEILAEVTGLSPGVSSPDRPAG